MPNNWPQTSSLRSQSEPRRWSIRQMMRSMIQIAVCTMAAVFLSGCATVVMRTDLSGSQTKSLYPATRADVTGTCLYLRNDLDPFGGWRGAGPSHHPNVIEKTLWVVFAAVDLPISLVTDTLCFPWDMADKRKRKGSSNQAPEATSEPAPGAASSSPQG